MLTMPSHTSGGPSLRGVDPIARTYYHYAFRVEFMRRRGTEFQTLFTRLMLHVHGEQFSPSGTWGSEGDLSCDGYLHGERRVFALYAPKDMNGAKGAKAKIRKDHAGAIEHWLGDMDHWTLVHNADPSLPASFVQLLKRLERTEPKVQVREWDCDRLRALLDRLDRGQLEDLFPGAPDRNDLVGISHADIKEAVEVEAPLGN